MGTRTGITLLAAAAAILLGAGSSSATTGPDLTITPGGISTWTAPNPKITTGGEGITCASVTLTFDFKSGSKATNPVAKVTKATWTNCPATITNSDLPWPLTLTSFTPATGVWQGNVGKIDAKVSAPGCSFTVDGTDTGADNGKAAITYSNATGVLAFTGVGNLHAWAVSGCFGLVSNGDPVSFKASAPLRPKQHITPS